MYLVDTAMSADEDKNIFISDQEILSLISAWKSQVGRDPTDDELARIINNLIDEEILYREALLLGLDQEDTIIKRRLAQKISFLKEESIPEIPTTEELKKYYENNKEKYYIEPSFTFTHYYFSENNNSLERSQQAIKALQDNYKVKSDPFYLGKTFANEPLRNINTNFGKTFSKELIEGIQAVLIRFNIQSSVKPYKKSQELSIKNGLNAKLPYNLYINCEGKQIFRDTFNLTIK